MIDTKELRKAINRHGASIVCDDELIELLDRLEAAEKELAELRSSMKFRTSLIGRTEAERDDLRAKIAEMEKQEPSHWGCTVLQSDGRWKEEVSREAPPEGYFSIRDTFPLYALPGAQPSPNAVAYLDLGTGGYMDIGTDLTDEALAALPKGRHMLGIVGTYGVDGYVPAQPAPSVPDGWKLVPIEPTPGMMRGAHRLVAAARRVLASADSHGLIRLDESGDVASELRSALEADPEAKP